MKFSAPRPILALVLLALFATAALAFWQVQPSPRKDQPPVAIVKGDTCAVCGMEIAPFPGPRAEAYVQGEHKVLKFGSTRDFFAFITQPDTTNRLEALYVQDYAGLDWAHPVDRAQSFIDARTAYYVGFQPLEGEMGPTFAAFHSAADAGEFVRNYGGAILRFAQITPRLVSGLGLSCPTAQAASVLSEVPCQQRLAANP